MAYLAASPVAIGVLSLLNVAGLTALVSTRIYEGVPRSATFPYVWIEIFDETDVRGFGTGTLPEIDVRVHAFVSTETNRGMKEAQTIIAKVIELLKDKDVTVSGWTQCGKVFYDRTTALPNEVVEGVKVNELVAHFRIYVES